jgi:GNAT superfamily N-acetyltransferase
MEPIKLIRTDSSNNDFQQLVELLDADLTIRDGEDHAFYHQFNKITNIRNAVVAYQDGTPAGCGAFKEYSDDSVEIKRMYVKPEYRGRGIANFILDELEKWAGELNYKNCVLETGMKQPEAIRLYERCGYKRIPNYGQYENVENSVCMKKPII